MSDKSSVYFMGRHEEYDKDDPRLNERMHDYRTVALPAILQARAYWTTERINTCAYCGSLIAADRDTCAQCGAPPTYKHTFHFGPVSPAAAARK